MRCALALAALALLASCGGEEDDTRLLPEARAIGASASITPAVHLFGDPVTARLEVIVDRRRLDPERLDARAGFAPYEPVEDTRSSRHDLGRYTKLTYEFVLRCLEIACVRPPAQGGEEPVTGGRRTFRFEPARLLYAEGGPPTLLRFAHWPAVESLSRINTARLEGSEFPFRASPVPLPAVSHRLPPALLAALLLVTGGGLLAPAAVELRRSLRGRRPQPVERGEFDVPPLERALGLVEATRDRDDAARRAALDELASELEHAGYADRAHAASALAWGRTPPQPWAIDELVDGARSEVDA